MTAPNGTGTGPARRRRRLGFNMIEVALGLGLIAFGLAGVLGMFPASLTAGRDSIAESYAAGAADEFLNFLAAYLKVPLEDYDNWDTLGKGLPLEKPGPDEPTEWAEWFSQETAQFCSGGENDEFYRIIQKAEGSTTADFAAVCRVWRGEVAYSYFSDGQWPSATASYDVAMAISVEISWPADLPYERRHKALYTREIYKNP